MFHVVILMPNSIQLFVHNPLTSISNKETSLRFFSDSEADTSELLENLEEMFPEYHINSGVISSSNLILHTGVLAFAMG